jgi:methionyl-tRNA synthetase
VPAVVAESAIGTRFADLGATAGARIAELDFRGALEAIWELVAALNRTIDERKPWELHKRGDDAALDAVLYELCEGIRWLAHLTAPFMPATARGIWSQFGYPGDPGGDWAEEVVWGKLAAGATIEPAEGALFPRIDAPPAA